MPDHERITRMKRRNNTVFGKIPHVLWLTIAAALLTACLAVTACRGNGTTTDTSAAEHTDSSEPEETPTSAPETDDGLTGSETADTTARQPDTDTEPSPVHPGDASAWDGLLIDMVYGTGKKNTDAAVSNGFIQLRNVTKKSMRLAGVSLYYKSDGTKPYAQFDLPEDAVIPAGGCYLILANSPDGYDTNQSIMGIASYDARWDIYLDNREIRLLLAPTGWIMNSDDDILSFQDAISVFYASDAEPRYSVFAVTDLSKNKVAVRTAKTSYSGYHLVNLTKADSAKLDQLCTVCSDGVVNSVTRSRIQEVIFSHPAGIYDRPIDLHLSAPDGYTVYYTTDGSDPKTSSTRKTVAGDIHLKDSSELAWGPTTKAWNARNGNARPTVSTLPGGYVIKAYATNGTDSTAVFVNTYFIAPMIEAYGVSVISLSIPLTEMIGSKGFYSNYCPTGVITDTRPRGLARMEVFNASGQRVGNSQVELAVSGNGSSGWAMKSLRIYYKGSLNADGGLDSELNYDMFGGRVRNSRGEAVTSFSRLLIRNSGNDCACSYIRDAYMQRVSQPLLVDTMASASTLVFVNGEFWGVYNMRERYSPEYVESHYGADKDDVTVIESDYSQVHSNTNADFVLSSGEEGDEKPFNDLYHFMRDNSLADAGNYEYVCSLMDIDSFIDMWVSRLFFVARDWPENNIKVWRNKNSESPSGLDTKWHFTILDTDMGLSFYDFTTEHENFFWAFDSNSVCGTLMRSLMRNEGFKQKFILRYYEVVNNVFTPEFLSAEFEELREERDALMALQQARWGNEGASVSTWNREVAKIRSFITKRQPIALQQLYSRFGISEKDIETMGQKRIQVSFSSARAAVSCNGRTMSPNEILRFDSDSLTIRIEARALDGYTLTAITWTGHDGQTQTVTVTGQQGDAHFTVTGSGTVAVYAKRIKSGDDSPASGTLIAGASYLFYLTETGDLYAWGDNRGGVLGLDTTADAVSKPTLVMRHVVKVATTSGIDLENGNTAWMTAILTQDGRLYTVGANGAGQLGRHGTVSDTRLGLVSFDGQIRDISVGHDHMLILDTDGVLWGIGNNSYGQIRAAGGNSTSFVRIADHVTTMSAGRRSTLYIDENGNLYGLGDNRWNKMVAGGADRLTTPTLLRSGMVSVSAGEHECLAIAENGDLYYAGWRDVAGFGQGNGNNPAFVKLMGGVSSASLYFADIAILSESGDVYVYGLNNDGAIGQAVTGGQPRKDQSVGAGVIAVAAGYDFTAYLYEDGSIRVRGGNRYGQAGTGQTGGSASLIAIYPDE